MQLIIYICLLISYTSAYFERRPPHFVLPIINISEQTVYDFGEGWASGWYRKNVTESWGPCVENIPNMFFEMIDFIPHGDLGLWANMLAKKDKVIAMVWEVPSDGLACTALGYDIYKLVIFIIKHITI